MSGVETKWTGARARVAERWFDGGLRRWRDRRLLRAVGDGLGPAETVVDLGAGTGFLTLAAARGVPDGRVVAVELSAEMLAALERRAEAAGVGGRVAIRQAEAAATGLDDGLADRVVCSQLLHEVPDREAVLREARRLLRPGGRLVLQDFRGGWRGIWIRWTHPPSAAGPYRGAELRRALEDAGFEGIEIEARGGTLRATASAPRR